MRLSWFYFRCNKGNRICTLKTQSLLMFISIKQLCMVKKAHWIMLRSALILQNSHIPCNDNAAHLTEQTTANSNTQEKTVPLFLQWQTLIWHICNWYYKPSPSNWKWKNSYYVLHSISQEKTRHSAVWLTLITHHQNLRSVRQLPVM